LAALKSSLTIWAAGALGLLGLLGLPGLPGLPPALAAPPPAAESDQPARIEARSADLLAVGTVHGDRLTIHLSRILDNAPVRNAAVTVVLRGIAHPATAEADGSYSLETPDLSLPGAAAVQFKVVQGAASEELNGMLRIADAAGPAEDKNGARQLGWWVLNFAVCIGILVLWRRRKAAKS
jgi:hypothetical protein